MTDRHEQHAVLRLFGVAVTVAVISATAVLVSIYRDYAVESRTRDNLEFHLRSLTQTRAISSQTADLERQLGSMELSAPGGGLGTEDTTLPSRGTSIAVYSMSQALQTLAELQSQFPGKQLQRALERTFARFEQLRQSLDNSDLPPTLATDLDALSLSVFQLDRLHSIEAERALAESAKRAGSRPKILGGVIAGVIAVTAALLWQLMMQLRAQLKHLDEVQAALLQNERQLMHAQKMEALGTLVGGVAHDFNNVLTGILGHAEMLLVGMAEDDPRHAGLDEVRKASERAARLIRQLLAFSRSDVSAPQIVDLTLLLRDLEPMLRRLIPADVSLVVDGSGEPARVFVDIVQIEQVLLNLTTNACDAMPNGGTLTLRIEAIEVEPDDSDPTIPVGNYARISALDTGHGIRPEILTRIFEPFFTTKEQGKGTGLGLSTVHGIVTKSRGYIFVESESGSGTRFDVYLPETESSETREAEQDAEPSQGTEIVLLVEDDEPVRKVAATILRSAGYELLEASNGADALLLCNEYDGGIDLILSDVVMPKMRGPEFVQRALLLFPDAAVVFMSGYSEENVLAAVRRLGSPLISKPFTRQQLLTVVRQELERGARRTQGGYSA